RMGYRLIPESLRTSYGEPPPKLPRSVGHYKEFIEACKGGPKPGSHFEFAGPLTEAVLLGNVALRVQLREKLLKQKLLWDSANLRVTNLPEANQFIKREYRPGWQLV
ncbi:MAG TPA: gfo/Idh/MocA family oxidoreductase, partial [Verrucomicrobiae bacterium]|nr:gfo/Idh/MocA family oxidoreductase [Verrucomicrobiae bacterium]